MRLLACLFALSISPCFASELATLLSLQRHGVDSIAKIEKRLDAGDRLKPDEMWLIFKTPYDNPKERKGDKLFKKIVRLHGGPNVKVENKPLLFYSIGCENRCIGRTDVLLEMGANPDSKDEKGRTALVVALSSFKARRGEDPEIAALALIEGGADLKGHNYLKLAMRWREDEDDLGESRGPYPTPQYDSIAALLRKGLDPRKLLTDGKNPYESGNDLQMFLIYFAAGLPGIDALSQKTLISMVQSAYMNRAVKADQKVKLKLLALIDKRLGEIENQTAETVPAARQFNITRPTIAPKDCTKYAGKTAAYLRDVQRYISMHYVQQGKVEDALKLNRRLFFQMIEMGLPITKELFPKGLKIDNKEWMTGSSCPKLFGLYAGPKAKSCNITLLEASIVLRRNDVLKMLIKAGADVNRQERRRPHRRYLPTGTKVPEKSAREFLTPLALAVTFRNVEACALLAKAGALVDKVDKSGKSPRMLARAIPDISRVFESVSPKLQPLMPEGYVDAKRSKNLERWGRPGWAVKSVKGYVCYLDENGLGGEVQILVSYPGVFLRNLEKSEWDYWEGQNHVLAQVEQVDFPNSSLLIGKAAKGWQVRDAANRLLLDGLQEAVVISSVHGFMVARQKKWYFYDEASGTLNTTLQHDTKSGLLEKAIGKLAPIFDRCVLIDKGSLAAVTLSRIWALEKALGRRLGSNAHPKQLASLSELTGGQLWVGMLLTEFGLVGTEKEAELLKVLSWKGSYKGIDVVAARNSMLDLIRLMPNARDSLEQTKATAQAFNEVSRFMAKSPGKDVVGDRDKKKLLQQLVLEYSDKELFSLFVDGRIELTSKALLSKIDQNRLKAFARKLVADVDRRVARRRIQRTTINNIHSNNMFKTSMQRRHKWVGATVLIPVRGDDETMNRIIPTGSGIFSLHWMNEKIGTPVSYGGFSFRMMQRKPEEYEQYLAGVVLRNGFSYAGFDFDHRDTDSISHIKSAIPQAIDALKKVDPKAAARYNDLGLLLTLQFESDQMKTEARVAWELWITRYLEKLTNLNNPSAYGEMLIAVSLLVRNKADKGKAILDKLKANPPSWLKPDAIKACYALAGRIEQKIERSRKWQEHEAMMKGMMQYFPVKDREAEARKKEAEMLKIKLRAQAAISYVPPSSPWKRDYRPTPVKPIGTYSENYRRKRQIQNSWHRQQMIQDTYRWINNLRKNRRRY